MSLLPDKPIYSGEKRDRSSTDKRLCRQCSRLATHSALPSSDNEGWNLFQHVRTFFCDLHLNQAIQLAQIRRIEMLPAYRTYLNRMRKWQEKQEAAGQGTLI